MCVKRGEGKPYHFTYYLEREREKERKGERRREGEKEREKGYYRD